MSNVKMKSKVFIVALLNIVAHFKTVYMWGVFGAPVTEYLIAKKSLQYPEWYTKEKQRELRKLIGKGYFAFDCVNTIKGILWGWKGNPLKGYGGATYVANGVPDTSADGMCSKLIDLSSDFSKIVAGEAVWMPGHIGVYIGDGKVVESTPKWKGGVQITACLNTKIHHPELDGRAWVKHGKIPYIDYTDLNVKGVK